MAPHESWSIAIDKDYLKFSAAHFLIFPDGSAERLHGHNYKVYVDLHTDLDEHGLVVNVQETKQLLRPLCDDPDELRLLPGSHPVLTATPVGGQYEVRYRDRHYLIPVDEVIVLPIGNTSAENLAAWFGRTLRERMGDRWPSLRLHELSVGVEETPGQRGIWTLRE